LRTRITVLFASGALLLAVIMALGTYVTARNYLITQRERIALRQAFADAAYIRDGLLTSGADVSEVLGTVSPSADAAVAVSRRGGGSPRRSKSGRATFPGSYGNRSRRVPLL